MPSAVLGVEYAAMKRKIDAYIKEVLNKEFIKNTNINN